ncbi:helix-turn-helix transcriptional regulator [Gemmobacter serpentinus]|uniref:helix-turn-helix transcriptional regulator n=1 Tax=Gemmobacter serpentinus TaxID=2652247 RepID=UPI00124E0044|nr:YafY family protein [Gemmobacter serpentinus]
MARTDRLMRLMDVLRRLPPPVTAARLAEETAVSPRQLYRDIATLRAGGALIDGEAGVGYVLTEDPALPPQSFSRLEIEALLLAVQSLDRIGDAEMSSAAREAMARIIATLPGDQPRQALHAIMHSFASAPERDPPVIDLAALRRACWDEEALEIRYTDLAGQRTVRRIWPLGLSYSDRSLMLLAHCRTRMDFRLFHVNRIAEMVPCGESFRPQRVPLMREFRRIRSRYPRIRGDGGAQPVLGKTGAI